MTLASQANSLGREQPIPVPEMQSHAHVTARPLRDQTQSELGYRPLQFHKRSQLFIGAHDEPLAVIAVRSAIPITTRLKPKENPTEVLNLHRPMLPFASSDQFQTLFSNNF